MASKVELELIALTRKAGSDIDRFSSGASSAMKAFGAIAAGALAVFSSRKILSAVSTVTKAASIQEDAINSLNSSLKLAGDFTAGASEDMQTFASKMQSVTKIGDETTLKMLGLAKSFGVSNEDAKRLVESAADLSEVTGTSLESAVRNLGKTYGGLTGELGEVIPALKDLSTEQLKSGAALDFISKRFGGAAAAATNTYSGAMEQLSNSFGDLQEELGFLITKNPVVIAVLKEMTRFVTDFTKSFKDSSGGIENFISEGIKELIRFMPTALRSIKVFAVAVDTLATVTPFGKLASLIGEVTGAGEKGSGIINALTKGYVKLARVVLTLLDTFIKIPDKIGEFLGIGDLSDAVGLDSALDRLSKLDDALDKTGQDFAVAVEGLTEDGDLLALAFDPAIDAADRLAKTIQDLPSKVKVAVEFDIPQPGDKDFTGPIKPGEKTKGLPSGALNFSDSPIFAFFEKLEEVGNSLIKSLGANITKGKAGGQAVLGAGATAGAAALGVPPELAGALGGIVTDLAGATKEEARQMAEDFALGITEGIKALVENAPIFIEALAENSGEIITAIIAAVPDIIVAIIKATPMIAKALVMELVNGIKFQINNLAPSFNEFGNQFSDGFNKAMQGLIKGVTDFPTAFGERLPGAVSEFTSAIGKAFSDAFIAGGEVIKSIGDGFANAAKAFINTLIDKAQSFIDAITPNFGGGGGAGENRGGVAGFWDDVRGAATGGLVGGKGNKDSEVMRLMPGELIIDKQRTSRLDKAIDNIEGNGMGEMVVLLSRILAAVSGTQTVQSEVRINERAFADIILQLSRSGARLTA